MEYECVVCTRNTKYIFRDFYLRNCRFIIFISKIFTKLLNKLNTRDLLTNVNMFKCPQTFKKKFQKVSNDYGFCIQLIVLYNVSEEFYKRRFILCLKEYFTGTQIHPKFRKWTFLSDKFHIFTVHHYGLSMPNNSLRFPQYYADFRFSKLIITRHLSSIDIGSFAISFT